MRAAGVPLIFARIILFNLMLLEYDQANLPESYRCPSPFTPHLRPHLSNHGQGH